jgi:hypothetical protein
MKEAVNFYISQGFRPMPIFSVEDKCKHRPYKPELDCKGQCWGKVPIVEHWPDHDTFSEKDFPEGCNLSLIMGKQLDSRWFVGLDIDGDLNIEEFLILPSTLECKTRRGRHLVYEVPADTPLGNWQDALGTRSKTAGYRLNYTGALDIKYCRGTMVSPPSKTKDGTLYEWIEWRNPEILPETEIRYLIRKVKFKHPKVKRYSKWSLDPTHFNKNP